MTTITIRLVEATSTPLGLRLGVTYAPRVPHQIFAGFAAVESAPNVFQVYVYAEDGSGAVLFSGTLNGAYTLLASCLGMTV